jgi:hypothetical protein
MREQKHVALRESLRCMRVRTRARDSRFAIFLPRRRGINIVAREGCPLRDDRGAREQASLLLKIKRRGGGTEGWRGNERETRIYQGHEIAEASNGGG